VGLVSKQQQEAEEAERRTEKDGGQADAIAEYYAALAAQKAKEAEEDEEEEDDDDEDEDEDEDEAEFEDLDVTGTGGAANSAAPSSGVATPATTKPFTTNGESEEDEDGAPPGKKFKVGSANATTASTPGAADGEDSDEEVDFEDV